jgi:hypothetical protein
VTRWIILSEENLRFCLCYPLWLISHYKCQSRKQNSVKCGCNFLSKLFLTSPFK